MFVFIMDCRICGGICMKAKSHFERIADGLITAFYLAFSILIFALCILQASIFDHRACIGALLIFCTLLLIFVFAKRVNARGLVPPPIG